MSGAVDTPMIPVARRLLAVALALLTFCWLPGQAEVYKWTDAQGKLHFSDRPPAEGNSDQIQLQPTNSYGGMPVDAEDADQGREQDRIRPRRAGAHKSVVMFSAAWCGYCRKAREYFRAHHVSFRERDVEKDPAARREFDRLGGKGLPLILVGNRRLEGFSERSFLAIYGD